VVVRQQARRLVNVRSPRRILLPGKREGSMLDLVFVLLTLGFFGLSWVYVRGCEKV
jgi:hypothetical protein